MRSSQIWVLAGVGIGVFVLYRWWQAQTRIPAQSIPTAAPNILDALTGGLQAGIDAGTYNAQDLRLQAGNLSNSLGTPAGAMNGYG